MKYTFYWLTGEKEVLEGDTPEDALNNAGYGAGALPALDFYAKGINNEYEWHAPSRDWVRLHGIVED